jgi:purine-binding chemotaxis protein CheW
VEGDSSQQNQYLSFFVAGEEYALGILEVKEIVEFTTLTKIPSTPTAIRGVVNLRGRVVPVVDLAVRFGLAQTAVTKRTCVVMVEASWDGDAAIVGILADSVSQVMELPAESVQAPPSFGTKAKAEFLKGMANAGEKFVLILDLERVLHTLAVDVAGETVLGDVQKVEAAAAV